MQISMSQGLAKGYKSPAQITRVITEAWGEKNFYCLNCTSPRLEQTRAGTKALDYLCPRCEARYELKGKSSALGTKIVDAAYKSMMETIRSGHTPNLFALHYNRESWKVRNLILIPRFILTASAIEKRKPLSATARRAGRVGCNILLSSIPLEARIPLVVEGRTVPPAMARRRYRRLRPLQELPLESRGWTLDVWNSVQKLGNKEFLLAEVYADADRLQGLHPKNRHVEPKIRQQLQRLRDMGFVKFLGRGSPRRFSLKGRYRLTG